MREYIRFLRFVKPHIWVLIIAIIYMIISSAFNGISLGMIIPLVDNILAGGKILVASGIKIPEFLSSIIDKVNALPKDELLDRLIIFVLMLFFIKELFTFFQSLYMSDLGQRVLRDVREAIYKKLLELSHDFYSKSHTGELVSRITFDTGIIVNSITEGLTDLLLQPVQLIIYLVVLIGVKTYFGISWKLTVVTLLLFPLVAYPVIRIGQRLRKLSRSTQEEMAEVNSALFETILGLNVIKAFLMESNILKRFQLHNNRLYKVMMKSVKRMIGITPITELTGVVSMVTVLWFGGREVTRGVLSPGAFIAFVASLLSLIKPFKRLSRLYGINLQAYAAMVRIFKILDQHATISDKRGAAELRGFSSEIRFEDVHFSYNGKEVLKGINLKVLNGEIIAIVGTSGVGKTTLVNLLPRFYDVTKGSIKIDGLDIRDIKLASLREKIGLVSQETVLLNDTVVANISFGKQNVSLEEVIRAASIANAHEFIMKMPQGYNTIIGERGFNLSGGERQRIAIARAIFKNPPILIFDEATSQLDTESEKLIQDAIDKLLKDRTTFVIAHRLSTISKADRIVVLEDGGIVEEGTHSTLMQKGGLYKKLYELQFK